MNVIDHISVGVPSVKKAKPFYDTVMKTLGLDCLAESDAFAAYGNGKVQFLIMPPADGAANSAGNGCHVAFVAPSASSVDAFHAAALAAGGTDEGKPGPREAYPMPVYTAFVRDPFGNKLEAIRDGFAS